LEPAPERLQVYPSEGRIDVRVYNQLSATGDDTDSSGTDLVVEISDSGIGISPESMARIFNAFEQGERSRTRVFGGLGLGLAISRAIIELHEGEITALSAGQGKGAKLSIRLPTIHAATVPLNEFQTPALANGAATTRSLRVLLVGSSRFAEQRPVLETRRPRSDSGRVAPRSP
jgi:hypothetical protein